MEIVPNLGTAGGIICTNLCIQRPHVKGGVSFRVRFGTPRGDEDGIESKERIVKSRRKYRCMDKTEFHCAEGRLDELNWQAKFRTHDVSNVFLGG
jgi:hypothetical protein